MKRMFASLFLFGALIGGTALASTSQADDRPAAEAPAAHEGFGPHAWVLSSLDSIALRPEQQAAVDQLKADIRARQAPAQEAHRQVREALAASVEAGALDHTRLDPLVAAARAGAAARSGDVEEAANRLHAILDAGQRSALVEAMRAKMHEGREGHHHGGRNHEGKLEKLAADLGLSEAQIDALRTRFHALHEQERATRDADHEGMKARHEQMRQVAAAFVSDSFDAHALHVGAGLHGRGPQMEDRVFTHVEIALPYLTPAQRTLLAQKIREGRVERALSN